MKFGLERGNIYVVENKNRWSVEPVSQERCQNEYKTDILTLNNWREVSRTAIHFAIFPQGFI